MPLTELAIRTAAACIGVSCVLFLYTHALLLIGSFLAGATKMAVSLVVYLLVAGAIGTGLLFVLGSAPDLEVRQSWKYVATVLAAWALIVTPGILYVRKHLRRLQSMGFFGQGDRLKCRIPDDCIDPKRYPLFIARAVLQELIESSQSTSGAKPC